MTGPPPLDNVTLVVLSRIHEAWSVKAPLAAYARLRDDILARREQADACIATLHSVACIAFPGELIASAQWKAFSDLAQVTDAADSSNPQHRKRRQNESNRRRNLALVTALWSPEVVAYYEWHTAGQLELDRLRACAVRFPHFRQDFCPHLNNVLLERHCLGIKTGRLKTLNEAPLQPFRDLDLVVSSSTTIDEQVEFQWTTNTNGAVSIDNEGTLLIAVRPSHFHTYLLQKDEFGLLVARNNDHYSNVHESRPPLLPQTTCSPSSPLFVSDDCSGRRSCQVTPTTFIGSDAESPQLQATEAVVPSIVTPFSRVASPDLLANELIFSPLSRDWRSRFDIELEAYNSPVPSLFCDPDKDTSSYADGTERVGLCMPPTSSSFDPHTEQHTTADTCQDVYVFDDLDDPTTWEYMPTLSLPGDDGFDMTMTLHSEQYDREPSAPTVAPQNLLERHSEQCPEILSSMETTWQWNSSTPSSLMFGSSRVQQTDLSRMEEVLHNRYRDVIACSLQQRRARSQTLGSESVHDHLENWLNVNSKWASVFTGLASGLRRGKATSPNQADLLLLASGEFQDATQRGGSYSAPIIIKEHFNDSGMHNMDTVADHLKDITVNSTILIRRLRHGRLGSTSVKNLDNFSRNDQCESDRCFMSIPNVTKAHRPLLTMLSRFRMLDNLIHRVQTRKCGSLSSLADDAILNNATFNICGAAGAFSGPQLSAVCGLWLRVLEGYQVLLLVKGLDMENEWSNYASLGNNWIPNGRERIIILEKDDIFYIPAGLRMIYALYSPVRSLIEGGPILDYFEIPRMVNAIEWVNETKLVMSDPIVHHYPRILKELQSQVQQYPDRFRRGTFGLNLSRMLEQAILVIEAMLKSPEYRADCR